MITLGIVVTLLALVVIVDLLFTFALAGRLRSIAENGVGLPLRNPDMPKPGLVIGDFLASDLDGVPVTRADLSGPVTVAFFTVGCPMCSRLAGDLTRNRPPGRVISFIEGDPDATSTQRLVTEMAALGRVCMITAEDPIVLAFALVSFPTVLRIHSGVVLASGARAAHLDEERAPIGAR